MYTIVICDDDKRFIRYMKRIIEKARKNQMSDICIYGYQSGEELLIQMEKLQIDLLILDMQMGKLDGDDTARAFRKEFPDAVLAFCSGEREPTVRSFETSPFRYLLKAESEDELVSNMKDILAEMERRHREDYFMGHYRDIVRRLRIQDVYYFANAKRGSRAFLCNAEDFCGKPVLVSEKLEELSKKFPNLVFAHNSYIVNLDHVNYIDGCHVHLSNGTILKLSRTYYNAFKQAYMKRLSSGYLTDIGEKFE